MNPTYSVIIPVYNRPGEVRELLESLAGQREKDFEVIVVEDGSSIQCEEVVREFSDRFDVRYYVKPNAGPGPARNFGFAHARGDYFVVFDSDCILPPGYFEAVSRFLRASPLDAWGGPDRGHPGFTRKQQAMAYTMASVLTTGGIRGGKRRLGAFQPRSFNMGLSRAVFDATGGFRLDRYAEDIDLSIRIVKAGFRTDLIPEAFVFHKRRTGFAQFFAQVFYFGKGRALVGRIHPDAIRITHWFPSVFTLGCILLPLFLAAGGLWATGAGIFAGAYLFAIVADAFINTRDAGVAILSVPAALFQLWGYGSGFFIEWLRGRSRNSRHSEQA